MKVGFIRKVLGIVFFQLLFTFSLVLYAAFNPSFASSVQSTTVLVTAFVMLIFTTLALFLSGLSRTVPFNYLALLVFTLCEALIVSSVSSMYTPESVILALCLFTLSTLTLWLASLCLSDIGSYAPVMFCSIITGLVLQLLALPVALTTANYDSYLVMEGMGASLIFSIYVVIDLKMIQEHMDVDDYILGAITLYIDLITLFVKILQVVGKRR